MFSIDHIYPRLWVHYLSRSKRQINCHTVYSCTPVQQFEVLHNITYKTIQSKSGSAKSAQSAANTNDNKLT